MRSVVLLLNDLGLVADWRTISGDEDFFNITKRIHSALQGAADELDATARDTYLRNAERNAAQFDESYDFVFVHDPQPLPLPSLRGKGTARWIWRCHLDTAAPNRDVWAFVRPFLEPFDTAVFTMDAFVPPDLPLANVKIIPPAIDPQPEEPRPARLAHSPTALLDRTPPGPPAGNPGGALVTYHFCSKACRQRFVDNPDHYLRREVGPFH